MSNSYQIFYSCDQGYIELLSQGKWVSGEVAAALVDHELEVSGEITRAGMTYNDINPYINKTVPVENPNAYINTDNNRVVFTHDRTVFIESGSLDGRFVFYVQGNPVSLNADDQVIGYIDLTGDENASAVDAEFSYIPMNDNLFDITRTQES